MTSSRCQSTSPRAHRRLSSARGDSGANLDSTSCTSRPSTATSPPGRSNRQADGGTHAASTKQIGGIDVVKVENKGKANRRLRIRITD
ncbi:MAG: hypothetical protein H0X18_05615 [Geodermatophilaceae bacterium]|nr:hypothetical protein [Geodermatophilaceae bacterium]